MATLYQQLGKEEEAREAGERFQKLSEETQQREHLDARIKVAYKNARELLDRGKMIEAESAFESVLELDPENVDVRSVLAKIAYSRGRLQEAMGWIEEALRRDDSNGELHYLLGLFQARDGNTAVAEPAARRAVELMPGFPDGWILLGSILSDSGRPREAVDCYLRAAALEPSNATIQLNLASAYDALGKTAEEDEAMARYRRLSSSEGGRP
jgi:tetratricopeptide (TPR) repeat protein